MSDLQMRREVLLERCAQQRVELAQRLHQVRAGVPLWPRLGVAGGLAARAARHPLAWAALLGAAVFAGRTRRLLSLVLFARSALSMATRGATLLRVLSEWRARSSAPAAARERAARASEDPSARL
jgi:hypothetical protein